jgi:hypothetical protein
MICDIAHSIATEAINTHYLGSDVTDSPQTDEFPGSRLADRYCGQSVNCPSSLKSAFS